MWMNLTMVEAIMQVRQIPTLTQPKNIDALGDITLASEDADCRSTSSV